MADALNIVFYPLVPTDGGDFQSRYLTGLTVSAYEVDLPNPVPSAAAQPAGNLIGTAAYDDTVTHTSANGIFQHHVVDTVSPPGLGFDVAASAASAVILVTGAFDAGRPYLNVVLHLERGADVIADRSINYDAPVVDLNLPLLGGPRDTYALSNAAVPCFGLADTLPSLYVGLSPPAGALASVDLSVDGSPPPFDHLHSAVIQVLGFDPAIIDPAAPAPDLAALTPTQCTHIAREMLWLRTTVNPVPLAIQATHVGGKDGTALEPLYTLLRNADPPKTIGGEDKDREEFQGALQAYYATLDAKTTVLAQYIFAMSAALRCAQRAAAADTAELTFPVRSGAAGTGQIAEAAIKLVG